TRFGWIHTVDLVDKFWKYGQQRLRLSRCNYIIGNNGSGKTSICSALTAINRPGPLIRRSSMHGRIEASVQWLDPQPRSMKLVADNGELVFHSEGRESPMPPRAYRCISIDDSLLWGRDGIRGLASAMNLDVWTVASLIRRVPARAVGRLAEVF